ncbi:MAG: polyketide synthase dehydratase domain-containing protein [Holophaga sp.]|nr:polyketide synthase dehydratase domain-containing protein [Holophaga sp.]
MDRIRPSPRLSLLHLIRQICAIPTLARQKDSANILGALAALYVNGASLKLDRLFWSPVYHKVSLPLYPFRQERYWLTSNGILDVAPETYMVVSRENYKKEETLEHSELPELPELHPLLGKAVTRTSRKTVFETGLKTSSPWTDHRVLDATVFPGTAYLEMAARGFAAVHGLTWQSVQIRDVVYERPLLLSTPAKKELTCFETPQNGSGAVPQIHRRRPAHSVYWAGRDGRGQPVRRPAG